MPHGVKTVSPPDMRADVLSDGCTLDGIPGSDPTAGGARMTLRDAGVLTGLSPLTVQHRQSVRAGGPFVSLGSGDGR
jgi:hypothetical protein